MVKHGGVTVANLVDAHRLSGAYRQQLFIGQEEAWLHANYLRHLEAGETLNKGKLHREAFLSLQLSIECFLKHAFCLVRYVVLDGNQLDLTAVPLFLHRAVKPFDLTAKKFEHDIDALIVFLLENVEDIDRPLLGNVKQNLRSRAQWISFRYENPRLLDSNLRKVYPALRSSFGRLLEAQFTEIR